MPVTATYNPLSVATIYQGFLVLCLHGTQFPCLLGVFSADTRAATKWPPGHTGYTTIPYHLQEGNKSTDAYRYSRCYYEGSIREKSSWYAKPVRSDLDALISSTVRIPTSVLDWLIPELRSYCLSSFVDISVKHLHNFNVLCKEVIEYGNESWPNIDMQHGSSIGPLVSNSCGVDNIPWTQREEEKNQFSEFLSSLQRRW